MAKSMATEKKESIQTNPLKITDTTFRDAHQSSFATRLRIDDMEPIAEKLDSAGFHSIEMWGGATFDVAHRFLGEDPWERVILLKKLMPKTPFQMLLRGQNLVGYRNYPDDVVYAFCQKSAEVGIDIFRVFDALNDERNFITAFDAIQKAGKHIQATICFSLTERKIGGPVFNMEYYIKKAGILEDMGAHSLCIKDMAGLISPYDAFDLITELKKIVKIPIQLHTHYTSGMASMAYLKAVEAGVDIVDCCLAPFALRSSQPAVEPIIAALLGTPRDTGLNLDLLAELDEYLETRAPKYREFFDTSKMAVIDIGVLLHQIPGGMQSNLINQLKEAGALDRLHEVHKDLPLTRKELGYPPLVTPTSQIVGVQAVANVLMGRYKMISSEVKDYCYGLYGKPPAQIDPDVQKTVLVGYPKGSTPITKRPGDVLEPEMEKAKEAVKAITNDLGDILIYALYPRTGMKYLRHKYGLDKGPYGEKLKTLEQIKAEQELIKKAKEGHLVEKPKPAPFGPSAKIYQVSVEGEVFEVQVQESEDSSPASVGVHGSAPVAVSAPTPAAARSSEPKTAPSHASRSKSSTAKLTVQEGEAALYAPMPGTLVRYEVAIGDKVAEGQSLVILEAMKMENALPSPAAGIIKALGPEPGSSVAKGDILLVINKQ